VEDVAQNHKGDQYQGGGPDFSSTKKKGVAEFGRQCSYKSVGCRYAIAMTLPYCCKEGVYYDLDYPPYSVRVTQQGEGKLQVSNGLQQVWCCCFRLLFRMA